MGLFYLLVVLPFQILGMIIDAISNLFGDDISGAARPSVDAVHEVFTGKTLTQKEEIERQESQRRYALEAERERQEATLHVCPNGHRGATLVRRTYKDVFLLVNRENWSLKDIHGEPMNMANMISEDTHKNLSSWDSEDYARPVSGTTVSCRICMTCRCEFDKSISTDWYYSKKPYVYLSRPND